jgi:hypothetical protein
MTVLHVVVDIESEPPALLGTWMPAREDDENIVRYFDSGSDEEEHIAPEDCVKVVAIEIAP